MNEGIEKSIVAYLISGWDYLFYTIKQILQVNVQSYNTIIKFTIKIIIIISQQITQSLLCLLLNNSKNNNFI
jgi:hypothetical protein